VIVPALIGGWFLLRDRIRMLAAEQTGTIAALQRADEGGA
jgi:L-asparagine permease